MDGQTGKLLRLCATGIMILTILIPLSRRDTASASKSPRQTTYIIALSDFARRSVWRSQMEKETKAEAMSPQNVRHVRAFLTTDAQNSVSAQITQMQSLIRQGVHAILLDAGSRTKLNRVIELAHRRHILVVSFDNLVTSPYAIKVDFSDVQWGAVSARYLVRQLHGRGRVVMIGSGASGRQWGAGQVFRSHAGMRVVARVKGGGNPPGGKRAVASLLARRVQFDAIWSSGGMATGIVAGLLKAHHRLVPITDSATVGFLKLLRRYKATGLRGMAVGDAPWLGPLALNVAVSALRGQRVPKTIIAPVRTYTVDDPVLRQNPHLSDAFNVDINTPLLGRRGQLTVQDVLRGACCYR